MNDNRCEKFEMYLSGKFASEEEFLKHAENCPDCLGNLRKLNSMEKTIEDSLNNYSFESSREQIIERAVSKMKGVSFKNFMYRTRYLYVATVILIVVLTVYYFNFMRFPGKDNVPLTASPGKLEIYLVKDKILGNKDINELTLDEEPIITLDDIEYCIWNGDNSQTDWTYSSVKPMMGFKFKNNINLMNVRGPFILICNDERIFIGAFNNIEASHLPSKYYQVICDTYPTNSEKVYGFYENDDKCVIFDKRIHDVLTANNLMKE
jgi:hypothetical protein